MVVVAVVVDIHVALVIVIAEDAVVGGVVVAVAVAGDVELVGLIVKLPRLQKNIVVFLQFLLQYQ